MCTQLEGTLANVNEGIRHRCVSSIQANECVCSVHVYMAYKKAVFKVSSTFANSVPKITTDNSKFFLELFWRNKRLFALICNNGQNLDPALHARVKLTVSWVDSSRWTLSKAAKSTADSWQGYGIHILGLVQYFVHWLLWKRQNS